MSNEQVALERVLRGKCVNDAAADAAIAGVIAAGFHMTPAPQVVKVVETVAKFCALDGDTWVKLATGQTGQARDCLVWYGDYGDQTDGSLPATVLYPHPTPDVGVLTEERCNCGFGGVHEPLNKRCALNGHDVLAQVRAHCVTQRDAIRATYDPSITPYHYYANACDDVLAILDQPLDRAEYLWHGHVEGIAPDVETGDQR